MGNSRSGIVQGGRRFLARFADPDDAPLVAVGVGGIAVALVLFSVMLGYAAPDVWTGLITALVVLTVAVPVLRLVAPTKAIPGSSRSSTGRLVAKFAGSMARFFMIFVVYGGNGDAGVYHEAGITFARRFADGIPIHPLPVISGFPVETHWIADVTGVSTPSRAPARTPASSSSARSASADRC